MPITTPVTQDIKLDPFNGRLFEYNNADSRIYLTHTINTLLDIYGTDVIVEGLTVDSLSLAYNTVTNTLSFSLIPGSAIIDHTLISISANELISINTAGLALASKSFAVFINFQYLQQLGGNPFTFKSLWFDPVTSTTSSPTDINPGRDRILLAVIDFDVTGAIPSVRSSTSYDVTSLRGSLTPVVLNTISYPLYPRSSISDNLARIILDSFY